jgi:hypothetical protein
MAKPNDTDHQQVLHLLRAALGDIDPKQPLHKLFAKAPQCGPFEWMLSILAMEIDLRVDIPEKLADDRKLTAETFATRVAALPKINFPTYTLDCLALVAQALLSIEYENSSSVGAKPSRARKGTGEKTSPSTTSPEAPSARGSKKARTKRAPSTTAAKKPASTRTPSTAAKKKPASTRTPSSKRKVRAKP